ncbi:MAG TPA: HWE histidine kinase domain-containing protein, partial [Kiloniellales bacterium]|nr:HWE histidine kinase domain-containing protein [Kiloniellales bacterium]
IEGEVLPESFGSTDQQVSDEAVRRLTQELELTQARLRTVREESEAANEELRAANEELQSINEEYRSTSEELETSKEELQSINEELQTVNSELKLKLETISRAHSDLQNMMAATDFGTLFLDTTLRIKRFTDRVTDLFSITPADEGRPITDFTHQLEYQGLTADARSVLNDLTPIQREIRSNDGRWYDLRMRPYRTVDNKIDGVVMTFVDITARLKTESALRESERQLRQQKRLVEMSRNPIFVWELDGGIVDWNRGCEELYGYTRQEALGSRKEQLLGTRVSHGTFKAVKSKLVAEGSWSGEVEQRTKVGRKLTVEARLDLEEVEGRRLVLESSRDVTERKALQERQQLLLNELTHRVKNSLAVVQSIAHQTLRTTPNPEEFNKRFEGRLSALAASHGLLVQSSWKGADLGKLARLQLKPHASGGIDGQRLQIQGPAVTLPADLATPFGLVLHELATNAAKHGALSSASGRVALNWSMGGGSDSPRLTVVWKETGGPAVSDPENDGFGSRLIDNGIPKAVVRREFLPDGFQCTIVLPIPPEPDGGTGAPAA